MHQTAKAASGIVILLAASLAIGCSSSEDQALANATDMANSAVRQMRSQVENAYSVFGDKARAFESIKENVASARRDNAEVLLNSNRIAETAWFDVAVVAHGNAGGGLSAAGITVRLCARLTVHLAFNPVKVQTSDLTCPPGLPSVIPGYGTIDKVVHLHR
jgi:hypothetical protein